MEQSNPNASSASSVIEASDYPSNITEIPYQTSVLVPMMSTPISPSTIIVQVLFGIVILVGNILNIVVACHPRFIFPISSRVAMVSMSASDCLLGATTAVSAILINVRQHICRFFLVISVTCVRVSVISLIFVIVDRYLAVVFPFRHQRLATKKVCIGLMLSAWVLTTLADIIENAMGNYFFDPRQRHCDVRISAIRASVSATLIYFFPLTAMIAVYTHLLFIVRKMARNMARIYPLHQLATDHATESTSVTRNNLPSTINLAVVSAAPRPQYRGYEHFKIILTFFAVTIAFTLTNIPNRIIRLVLLVRGPGTVPSLAIYICRLILISGSWWNFVIFSLMNASFRSILKKIFACKLYRLFRLRVG
ncbi:D(1A) dopamine receptor-like [Diadema setosum]|uniref:D(1A) dopamine receptor-like n=1 Tax=Diadema setosum TaxID=31175 RepID=UPI003B3BB9CC